MFQTNFSAELTPNLGYQIYDNIQKKLFKYNLNFIDSMDFVSKYNFDNIIEILNKLDNTELYNIQNSGFLIKKDELILEFIINNKDFGSQVFANIATNSYKNLLQTKQMFFNLLGKNDKLKIPKINIDWFYNTPNGMGNNKIVEILDDECLDLSYPNIVNYFGSLSNFVQDYLNSSNSILLLKGSPGLGKTRLMRYILKNVAIKYENNNDDLRDIQLQNVLYTMDQNLLESDIIFSKFISDNYKIAIFEDIDYNLIKRVDGNNVMPKFLNASDGIINHYEQKIIFSTNIKNRIDIDEALLRPGRCFAYIEFQAHTYEQACLWLEYFNISNDKLTNRNYTLAELYKILENSNKIDNEDVIVIEN